MRKFFPEFFQMSLLEPAPDNDNSVVDGAVDEDGLQRGVGTAQPHQFSLVRQGHSLQLSCGVIFQTKGRAVADSVGCGEGIEPLDVFVAEGRNLAEKILPVFFAEFHRRNELGIVRLFRLDVKSHSKPFRFFAACLAPEGGGRNGQKDEQP